MLVTMHDFFNLAAERDFPDVIILHPEDFYLLQQRVQPATLQRDDFGPFIYVFGMKFRPKIKRCATQFLQVDISEKRQFEE